MKVNLRCPFCLTLNRLDLEAAGRPVCGKCSKPILVDRPVRVEGEDFQKLIADAEVPVLVDFYADWCGPCKMMAPLLDEIAGERSGRLLVVKLDTDRSPEIARAFGIQGIPTLILFRDGKPVSRQTGAVPRPAIEAMLDDARTPTA
ncbi:MAG: thioredoxin [Gemmatimonadota bacterium]|nr:MAG: thioredoxin [Gemmatimonadota bacterium]